jgi:hypothetical protein
MQWGSDSTVFTGLCSRLLLCFRLCAPGLLPGVRGAFAHTGQSPPPLSLERSQVPGFCCRAAASLGRTRGPHPDDGPADGKHAAGVDGQPRGLEDVQHVPRLGSFSGDVVSCSHRPVLGVRRSLGLSNFSNKARPTGSLAAHRVLHRPSAGAFFCFLFRSLLPEPFAASLVGPRLARRAQGGSRVARGEGSSTFVITNYGQFRMDSGQKF